VHNETFIEQVTGSHIKFPPVDESKLMHFFPLNGSANPVSHVSPGSMILFPQREGAMITHEDSQVLELASHEQPQSMFGLRQFTVIGALSSPTEHTSALHFAESV
jgi:hypothetical protein